MMRNNLFFCSATQLSTDPLQLDTLENRGSVKIQKISKFLCQCSSNTAMPNPQPSWNLVV